MRKDLTSTNAGIRYIPIKFDIMVNDRYYHTITILHKRFSFLDEDNVKEEIIRRLPTLKNIDFRAVIV